MTSIGIREFKTHLSRYVRRVKEGESIALTERGKTVAILEPNPQSKNQSSMWDLARRGVIRWSGGKPIGLHPRIPSRGKLASEMVIEDREDRVK